MGGWGLVLSQAGPPVATALAGGIVAALGSGARRLSASLLVHGAAGAFVAIALLHLVPEAARHAGALAAGTSLAAGAAACWGFVWWTGAACPGCLADRTDQGHPPIGLPLLLVVGLHCLLDGVALGASSGEAGELLSLAVIVHKLAEGLAVAAVCRAAGMAALPSLALTALVESFTFAGAWLGGLLGAGGELWLGSGLGLVAGTFLAVAGITLSSSRAAPHPARNTAAVLAGAAGAGLLLILTFPR